MIITLGDALKKLMQDIKQKKDQKKGENNNGNKIIL